MFLRVEFFFRKYDRLIFFNVKEVANITLILIIINIIILLSPVFSPGRPGVGTQGCEDYNG